MDPVAARPVPDPPTPVPAAPVERPCAHCGAPLAAGQDWCLECGAGAPVVGGGRAVWRPAATVLALTGLLVIGTVAAAYAALSSPSRSTVTRPSIVALALPAAHPAAPVTPAPPPVTAPTHTPLPATKPPPLLTPKAVTPPRAAVTPTPVVPSTSAPVTTSTTTHTSTTTTAQPRPDPGTPAPTPHGAPVLLDPGAASTYSPGGYPDSAFGDPTLAVDGDASTAWSVQLQSAKAPDVKAGLVLDLNARQRLSSLKLITDTPGISVGIYGANRVPAASTPAADPGWKLLSPVRRTKRTSAFTLLTAGVRYRYVLVWINRAPAASTPAADLNEISLTH